MHLASILALQTLSTILDWAEEEDQRRGMKWLVDAEDKYGRSPAMLAAYGGYVECLKLLAGRGGCDLRHRDNEGTCALHWAAIRGHLDAVGLILDAGDAFVNSVGTALTRETRELVGGAEQFTALDCAVCREHHEVARRLLGRGGVTVAALRDAAAVKIQAFFRGAVIRDGAA